jgi:hypothetical protein
MPAKKKKAPKKKATPKKASKKKAPKKKAAAKKKTARKPAKATTPKGGSGIVYKDPLREALARRFAK